MDAGSHFELRESSGHNIGTDFCWLDDVAPVLCVATHRSRSRAFVIAFVDLFGRQFHAANGLE